MTAGELVGFTAPAVAGAVAAGAPDVVAVPVLVAIGVGGGLVMAAVAAVLTGFALLRLLRRSSGRAGQPCDFTAGGTGCGSIRASGPGKTSDSWSSSTQRTR